MRDLRGPQQGFAILRLHLKNGGDQPLGDLQIFFGLIRLAEIRADGDALDAGYAHMGRGQIQIEHRVSPVILGQSREVLQGSINDNLPGLRSSWELANLNVNVEEAVR